ncbi:hypothetical protein TRICI_001046 [Trichomonascus ciferrii]|uniref:RING-type domain-containing protein n=1 Tax=Trichomonascus ciferrii TaxID=44093 RepID=A0A642V9J3_9ASCO|nr:hypothetical protein TRICI_001046 [Trichomonascus ciferrii]
MSTPQFNVQAAPFQPGGDKGSSSSEPNKPGSGARGGGGGGRGRKRGKKQGRGGSRGQGRKETPRQSVEEELLSKGSRNKRGEVSISHLMDFSTPGPVRRQNNGHPPPRRTNQQSRRWVDPQAEKIAYINTTCRFVLHPGVDYKGLMQDPDSPVPMEHVMRIITQASSCPICLEEVPEAARMLECGHILCYPCLFRFLRSENVVPQGETKPRKHKECPFCFDRVRPHKIKPVSFSVANEQFDTPRADNDVVLKLMFRPSGAHLALPKDTEGVDAAVFEDVPTTDLVQVAAYSRLAVGTLDYLVSEFDREIEQLQQSRSESKAMFEDSGEFHTEAINSIEQVKQVYLEPETKPEPEFSEPTFSWDDEKDVSEQIAKLSLEKEAATPNRQPERPLAESYDDSTAYFFYQAGFDTITKFFLAPLDVRILRAAYGAYSAFPSTLVVKVENVLYGTSITPELRKRMKYLSHLPLQTQIGFLECDWRGQVPDDVLKTFSKELSNRRKKKKDKERREERDRRNYQRQEEELFRQELLQESYLSTPYIRSYSTPIPPPPSVLSDDPALPSQSQNNSAQTPSNQNNPISFAAVASGETPTHERDRQIEQILSSAQPKRKGGKKLVLMSNQGQRYD